ncbi:hypothetical protein [Nonomuraea sp. CA-141351]|uniref:hypothetical protein n=1 Tax=Nonomuraea sp. CA-141351 TaxID=3239996 RepID=UPI003D89D75F
MNTVEIIIGVFLGLLVNEMCDISPWLARRLVRWSARHQYVDRWRADIRAEELVALVNERPGKLLKLASGLAFATAAVLSRGRGRIDLILGTIAHVYLNWFIVLQQSRGLKLSLARDRGKIIPRFTLAKDQQPYRPRFLDALWVRLADRMFLLYIDTEIRRSGKSPLELD